ncbi:hypothetical protein TNCT_350661 [Trichonephila clavata]|uniref:Uncharacterized protein n=1 Tax=Trichonephila clavata TaxID=2740835 RepID=A0A8X6L6P5_TRICU|nr:hypothetical protein TNCT_350661 [Trichonephila clavata]
MSKHQSRTHTNKLLLHQPGFRPTLLKMKGLNPRNANLNKNIYKPTNCCKIRVMNRERPTRVQKNHPNNDRLIGHEWARIRNQDYVTEISLRSVLLLSGEEITG